jgi:hypothetical protein
MRKTHTQFERVPVAVVEKILQMQESLAKRNGNRKLAIKKSGKSPSGPHAQLRKAEVLVP